MSKIDLGRKIGDMVSIEPMDKDEPHFPISISTTSKTSGWPICLTPAP